MSLEHLASASGNLCLYLPCLILVDDMIEWNMSRIHE